MKKLSILHASDLHLGVRPDPAMPWCEVRSQEITDSFRRFVRQVSQKKPDLLLLTGDLFHMPPSLTQLREMAALLETIPDTKVVLCAGNHDYISRNSGWLQISWPSNVTALTGRKLIRAVFPELDAAVYGLSYYSRQTAADLYADAKPFGQERYHILLAHGGDAQHSPFRADALAEAGFDYIACGHIHKPGILIPGRAAYAGALEPIDRNDTGPHGYLDVHLAAGTPAEISFVPFAARSYRDLKIDAGQYGTAEEIRIQTEKEIRTLGTENFYRIILCGKRKPGNRRLSQEFFSGIGNITEVRDETADERDFEALEKSYEGTVLGDYIRTLRSSSDPAAERALEIGIDAFLGRDQN